jgi:hypothetical protein
MNSWNDLYCSSVLTEASKLPPAAIPLKDALTLVENRLLTELSELEAQTFYLARRWLNISEAPTICAAMHSPIGSAPRNYN